MPDPVVEHRTLCRCCSVACGIVVRVAGERVLDVRGDRDHPLSRGYTCPKGRGLAAFHHGPDRLDHPVARGARTDWTTVLDEVASGLRSVLERHGPEHVGYYSSTGTFQDTTGWTTEARFFHQLGPVQHYTAATVDIAPAWRAAELVLGVAKELHPVWVPEHESPELVVFIGCNPVV